MTLMDQTWQQMQSEQEQLVLVNSDNQIVGQTSKIAAHQNGGQLHRAVTVFLTNSSGEILTTQRSEFKPLWPLWWDAAVSTHQWPQEDDAAAASRRLPFEIGIKVAAENLKFEFNYEYHAVYDETWSENEINYIFSGQTDDQPQLNTREAAAYQWKSVEQIKEELQQPDHHYAPWFVIAFERLYRD